MSWPMSHEVPDDEQWVDLNKGGKHGFALLLIGLCWWRVKAGEVGSGEKRDELDSAVEDVRWVLEQIDKGMESGTVLGPGSKAGEKRAASDNDEGSPRKKT